MDGGGWYLGQEDPLEGEMTTHSSILAWKTSWIEEPGQASKPPPAPCFLMVSPDVSRCCKEPWFLSVKKDTVVKGPPAGAGGAGDTGQSLGLWFLAPPCMLYSM